MIELARVEPHLHAAHPRRHIQDTRDRDVLQRLLEHVHAEAQRQIGDGLPVLDDEVLIARPPVAHRWRESEVVGAGGRRILGEDRVRKTGGVRARADGPAAHHAAARLHRAALVTGPQPHAVTGSQLPDLPAIADRDAERRREAPEARAVRADDDRGRPAHHDRSERVRRLGHVARIEAGVAAAVARPLWLRTAVLEAHAGAVGHRPDGPDRGEHGLQALGREDVRGAVRTVQDVQHPRVASVCAGRIGVRLGAVHDARVGHAAVADAPDAQPVTGDERPPLMPTEPARDERRPRTEVLGDGEPAAERDVDARAPHRPADVDERAGGDGDRLVGRSPLAVDGDRRVGTGDRDHAAARHPERGPLERRLEAGGAGVVADERVGVGEAPRIHRARRRHADLPQPRAARQVLHRREHAGALDLDDAQQAREGLAMAEAEVGVQIGVVLGHHAASPVAGARRARRPAPAGTPARRSASDRTRCTGC